MTSVCEIWRPVPAFEGFYEASSLGQIRRASGEPVHQVADNGYLRVSLRSPHAYSRDRVHQVVAAAFIGPCPKGLHVNHIDGDKRNNRVENLEYITASANTVHQHRIGLSNSRGEGNGHAKLTEDAVRFIRANEGKIRTGVLARMFSVSPPTICGVQRRRVWKHVR